MRSGCRNLLRDVGYGLGSGWQHPMERYAMETSSKVRMLLAMSCIEAQFRKGSRLIICVGRQHVSILGILSQ